MFRKKLLVWVGALLMLAAFSPVGAAAAHGNPHQQVTETVGVPARAGWVDSGLYFGSLTPFTISASGSATCWVGTGACDVGPDGASDRPLAGGDFLVPGVPQFSLVGKIGNQVFFIGTGPLTVRGNGELYLAFDDNVYGDNGGGFTATISYTCQPGKGLGDKNHCHSGAPGQK